jgi:hypothetical protein
LTAQTFAGILDQSLDHGEFVWPWVPNFDKLTKFGNVRVGTVEFVNEILTF